MRDSMKSKISCKEQVSYSRHHHHLLLLVPLLLVMIIIIKNKNFSSSLRSDFRSVILSVFQQHLTDPSLLYSMYTLPYNFPHFPSSR